MLKHKGKPATVVFLLAAHFVQALYGSMSFVWSQNHWGKNYFSHRGKFWSVGSSALAPEEVRTLWGATGSLWELL